MGLRRPPPEVRTRVAGEQALAWAVTAQGGLAVATRAALHLPDGARRPWDLVVNAGWEPPLLRVTVQDRPGATNREVELELVEPGRLPAVVRERVTWSVVAEQHVDLDGERGVRIVARRTEDGGIRWAIVFDPGLDRSDPRLRDAADEALARVRAAWGV